MKEQICSSCRKSYASSQSLWNHKQRCKRMHVSRKTGSGTSNEILKKILQSPHEEPEEVKKHRTNEDIVKILQKVLQSLDKKSEDKETSEDEETSKGNEKEKMIQDIENKIFQEVTLEEKKRFYKLLNELKIRKSRLTIEDFEKIDRILPQYFEKEYKSERDKDGIWIKKGNLSDQIRKELRALQRELPLLSLEMQMILTFIDNKRWTFKSLLSIMESSEKDSEKDKSLLKKELQGVISEEEYQELKKDLSMDTITRVLLKRKFKPMYSEICNM